MNLMNHTIADRNCLHCGKPVKGRIDKKFCDDWCRNAFNNRLNSATNGIIRNINNALRRNRRILEELLPDGKQVIRMHRQQLLARGFDFGFITHTRISRKGMRYSFCYEYGYCFEMNSEFLLIRKNLFM